MPGAAWIRPCQRRASSARCPPRTQRRDFSARLGTYPPLALRVAQHHAAFGLALCEPQPLFAAHAAPGDRHRGVGLGLQPLAVERQAKGSRAGIGHRGRGAADDGQAEQEAKAGNCAGASDYIGASRGAWRSGRRARCAAVNGVQPRWLCQTRRRAKATRTITLPDIRPHPVYPNVTFNGLPNTHHALAWQVPRPCDTPGRYPSTRGLKQSGTKGQRHEHRLAKPQRGGESCDPLRDSTQRRGTPEHSRRTDRPCDGLPDESSPHRILSSGRLRASGG